MIFVTNDEALLLKGLFRLQIRIDTNIIILTAYFGEFQPEYGFFMRFGYFAFLAVATAVLTACGGGGGSDAVPAPATVTADKYVGTWGNCAPVTGAANGVLSARTDFVFAKTGPTTLTYSLDGTYFKAVNCTGPVFDTIKAIATGTATINGTKVAGSDTVDRVDFVGVSKDIPELNGAFKEIALITGNILKFSASSTADAQGYPTALDNTTLLTKQP